MKTLRYLVILTALLAVSAYGKTPQIRLLIGGSSSSMGIFQNTVQNTNQGTVVQNNPMSTSSMGHFEAGLGLEAEIAPRFTLSADVLYAGRGAKIENLTNNGVVVSQSVDLSLRYIEVPMMIRYYAHPYISLGVGAYFAFRVGEPTLKENNVQVSLRSTNEISSYDFGLVFGIGGRIPLKMESGPKAIILDARYHLGLKNIYEQTTVNNGTYPQNNTYYYNNYNYYNSNGNIPDLKNNAFTFHAGVVF